VIPVLIQYILLTLLHVVGPMHLHKSVRYHKRPTKSIRSAEKRSCFCDQKKIETISVPKSHFQERASQMRHVHVKGEGQKQGTRHPYLQQDLLEINQEIKHDL